MAYNVLDVCRFVINYSNEQDYGITNLKLQKLLYFIQAYFLVSVKRKCFNEKIEAWEFGPVVPEAYQEYKQFGAGEIPPVECYYVSENSIVLKRRYDVDTIKTSDRNNISDVVDEFRYYSAADLVKLTHNQDPWKNAYVPYGNNEITTKSIEDYFNE